MEERILIVDDHPDVANALARLVTCLGYEAKAVYHGQTAIEEAARFAPDMVIIDLAMPGLDGHQTMQEIRRRSAGTHMIFVALTGFAEADNKQRAYQNGFDFFVAKPMTLETLKDLLALLDPTGVHRDFDMAE
jgi:CheY-like chemotaxis protein